MFQPDRKKIKLTSHNPPAPAIMLLVRQTKQHTFANYFMITNTEFHTSICQRGDHVTLSRGVKFMSGRLAANNTVAAVVKL